jgi:putative holliday junction resolvase
MQPGRALGVDLGARRVGLALSDPQRIISSPHATIPMISESALVRALGVLCAQHGVSLVVIGLPLSADGTEGPGCARARRIAEALRSSGMKVQLQDERWSSRDAEDILRETGTSRRRSKNKGKMSRKTATGRKMPRGTATGVDAIAASLILSEYLREVSRP